MSKIFLEYLLLVIKNLVLFVVLDSSKEDFKFMFHIILSKSQVGIEPTTISL